MEWKKNDRIQVKIEDMGDTGEGIGKTDGFTWFVKDAVIGDEVEAKVMKTKKSYGYARLEKIVNASPNRVTPPCPVARQCGGCQLQAMDYEEQLKYKERKIYNNIKRIGGFDEVPMLPVMGMEEPWRYRNKAQFPWGTDKAGKIITGFYAGRTHAIIENEDCLLGIEENREILKIIKKSPGALSYQAIRRGVSFRADSSYTDSKGISHRRADGMSGHQWKEPAPSGGTDGAAVKGSGNDEYFS